MKLLKKDGKLVKKGGKLVKTDDPAACPCCGAPPPPCKPAPDCQDAFNSKAQCNGKQEAWVNCSNNDCTANDFQEAKCLDGLPEALESQGWNVVVRNEQCCECGPTGSGDGTQLMNVFACCDGTADGLVANFIYIPRNEDDPCQWCSGLSGVEAQVRDGKPVWAIQRCVPTPPPDPCKELPLRAGRWGWIVDGGQAAGGRWIPVDNGCTRFPGNCTMGPPPNRAGAAGEVVDVGCITRTREIADNPLP